MKKKTLLYLEIAVATSLALSKYFLAINNIIGWWLSITGYSLTTIYNVKIKLKIVAVITAALASLSVYGLYKWSNHIPGLQLIDILVIGLSILFSIILIVREAQEKKPFWLFQTIAIIAFSSAFITLGMKMEIGWYLMALGHVNNFYLYYKKEAYIISLFQVVSLIIVLYRIFV